MRVKRVIMAHKDHPAYNTPIGNIICYHQEEATGSLQMQYNAIKHNFME